MEVEGVVITAVVTSAGAAAAVAAAVAGVSGDGRIIGRSE